MKHKTLVIAPIHDTFFVGRLWYGLDLDLLEQAIKEKVPNLDVRVIPFDRMASDYRQLPENCLLFYSTSYTPTYQAYIRDVILDLSRSRSDVALLPNLDQLLSFENKGYQELLKRRLGIERVEGSYWGDFEDFRNENDAMEYPFVFKELQGSVSTGVSLIQSESDFKGKEHALKGASFIERLRKWKKRFYPDEQGALKPDTELVARHESSFAEKRAPFVAQKFYPGLEYDFKVLVFGDRYFVLKRFVREKDFRASGSGRFEFVKPDDNLLDYAASLMKKFNVPFISLDIIESDSGYGLVEFQGIGFGPYTVVEAATYFFKSGDDWDIGKSKLTLEEYYAEAIENTLL